MKTQTLNEAYGHVDTDMAEARFNAAIERQQSTDDWQRACGHVDRARAEIALEYAHLRQRHEALEKAVERALIDASDNEASLEGAAHGPCPRCGYRLAVDRDCHGRVRLYDCLHCGWLDHYEY